jgi:hypothetical protein
MIRTALPYVMKHECLSRGEDEQEHVLEGVQRNKSWCKRTDKKKDQSSRSEVRDEKQGKRAGPFKECAHGIAHRPVFLPMRCVIRKQ